jgi:hypothetical protein
MSHGNTNGCASCAHCDRDEATTISAGVGGVARHVVVGICTKRLNWFHGKHVIDWIKGCDDHEPVALPQGDGDMGSEAA